MSVRTPHKDYAKASKIWQICRDTDEGAQAVKTRVGSSSSKLSGEQGTAYLPPPEGLQGDTEGKERFKSLLMRACFVNFVAPTKDGMMGLVFRKETEFELDASIDYLRTNTSGDGLPLDQAIKDVAGDVALVGRYGLLTDYPSAPGGLTVAASQGMQAHIQLYPAESILYWRTESVGGVKRLSMIKLREMHQKISEDGFDVEELEYTRVLLMQDGVYIQRLYDDQENLVTREIGQTTIDGKATYTSDIIPRNFQGQTWNKIPFQFIGATNNDETIDKAPVYDIAEINLAHYRNSADFEDSSHLVGQPTPVFSGLTQSWVDQNMANGVTFGSRAVVALPESGSATLLQAANNTMPMEGMALKERQMVMLGARIISDAGGVETAEAAKIRFAGQNSKLGTIVINVEAAFRQSIMWAMEFMGGTMEPVISINREFYRASVDPQLLMAEIQLLDRGLIADSDMRTLLRNGGLIAPGRLDEDIEGEAEVKDVLI